MEIYYVVLIFVAIVLFIEAVFMLFRYRLNPEARRIRAQLKQFSDQTYTREEIDLTVRRRNMSEISWLNRFLSNTELPMIRQLDRMAIQSNLSKPLGFYLLAAAVLFLIGFIAATFAALWITVRLASGLLLGSLPIFYIYIMRRKRLARFEEQFPDALDMMARSLRAGHALTGSLQMVAQEFEDPLGPEFGKTLNEINYGSGIEAAFRNLIGRIDSDDLKLFVLSVAIQRESGGNLAEILENISRLIRERFVFKGQIRSLSGEARLSAYVLIALPFFVGFVIYLTNPNYVRVLIEDPLGHMMLVFAGVMMIAGIAAMKKMIVMKI